MSGFLARSLFAKLLRPTAIPACRMPQLRSVWPLLGPNFCRRSRTLAGLPPFSFGRWTHALPNATSSVTQASSLTQAPPMTPALIVDRCPLAVQIRLESGWHELVPRDALLPFSTRMTLESLLRILPDLRQITASGDSPKSVDLAKLIDRAVEDDLSNGYFELASQSMPGAPHRVICAVGLKGTRTADDQIFTKVTISISKTLQGRFTAKDYQSSNTAEKDFTLEGFCELTDR